MGVDKFEIPIEWEGRKETVIIKKLNFGETNDLRHEATEIKIVGNTYQAKVHTGRFMELAILKSIVQAPFKNSIEDIRNIPREIGEMLYGEIEKFNNLSEEKKAS